MNYVDFIEDEYLEECVKELYNTYEQANNQTGLEEFYKNKVDPIKAYFDMKFYNFSYEEFITFEINRQKDKTISSAIGTFHQKIIGGIKSKEIMEDLKKGHETKLDVKNRTNTIFGEVKNKHNTIKGEDRKNVYKKLKTVAEEYTNATCYCIEIISKESVNEIWKFKYTDNKKQYEANHPRVRRISVDKFYEIITGDPNAFLKICNSFSKVANNLNLSPINTFKPTAYDELFTNAKSNDYTLLEQLYKDTFETYEGFKDM